MAHSPDLHELASHLNPVAQQYRAIVEVYTGDETLPAALQFVTNDRWPPS